MPSATRSPPSGLRSTSYRCARTGYVARCRRQARRAHWKLRLKPLTEGIVGSGKLQGCLRFRPSGCKALNSRTRCTPPLGTTTQSTSGSHSRLTLLFDEDLLRSVHAGHLHSAAEFKLASTSTVVAVDCAIGVMTCRDARDDVDPPNGRAP